ncbi:MAG: PTS sugar transporter subunit IIA [Acidobacteria bacterium]|nr:MAG: PTS sugar transporter subunit IIA [Acidobacteriota bacterium]MCE7958850.1 PTS sugar transporter subunit IIA [Acidobacteria bacterium ACB2]
MTTAQRPAAPAPNAPVGLLLVSHGPLAAALRDTIRVLEPDDPEDVEALSLAWDEAPEHASQRLEKAIGRANRGRGVVLLTDMFGGTPSNLALAFLDRGRIEIVSGVNLPMVVKARALAREGRDAREIAHALVDRGRRSILAAAELMEAERRAP